MQQDIRTVAATLYGEARGEGLHGMIAVACVIRNRVSKPCWWGKDIQTVCHRPFQFSCWNPDDPNRKVLVAIEAGAEPKDAAAFADCVRAAELVFIDNMADIVQGATSYCTKAVAKQTYWAQGQTPLVSIGAHNFYRIA